MSTTATITSSDSSTSLLEQEKSGEQKEEKEDRDQWENQIQAILVCVGACAGLGNIWRFPAMAYENGGGAFLIPYICCSVFIGLPMIYAECYIGQWARSGAPLALRRFAPAFEGFGWVASIDIFLIGIYYIVVLAWASLYLFYIIGGQSYRITTCDNPWNVDYCIDSAKSDECRELNRSAPVHLNGTCFTLDELNATGLQDVAQTASEQFFVRFVTTRSAGGILDFGSINWPMFGSLLVMWILTYLAVVKGVKIMGRLAYVISTTPYILIVILFIRGATLENARAGLDKYLLDPDYSMLLNVNTWSNALVQSIYSLAIGDGVTMTLTSFNKRTNNCFRDACIIICGDTFMSVVAGGTVYSVLGYLAFATGKKIEDIVMSGTSVVFIVYPEALSKMPWPWFWQGIFFLIIFFLGWSTMVVSVQAPTSVIVDNVPRLRGKTWLVCLGICLISFLIGILFVTEAGWYWFNLYADFTSATLSIMVALAEAILLAVVYGFRNRAQDCVEILGQPTLFSKIIGGHSIIWRFAPFWCIVAMLPVFYLSFDHSGLNEGFVSLPDGKPYTYPMWSIVLAWIICLVPFIWVPWYFYLNYKEIVIERKLSIKWLFRPSPAHPSFARIYGQPYYPVD